MTEKQIILKWALFGSVIYLIFGLLGYLLGADASGVMSFIVGLVLAFPILMASFEFRDKFNDSYATLGQIFRNGIKITIFLVIVAAAWSYIYPTFLNENFLAEDKLRGIEELKEYGLTDEQIEEQIAKVNSYLSPIALLVLDKVIKVFLFGIFVSLVSGLIIRNEKPREYEQTETEN